MGEVWKDGRVALLTLLACPVQAALNKAALDNRSCSCVDLVCATGGTRYDNPPQLADICPEVWSGFWLCSKRQVFCCSKSAKNSILGKQE